MKDIKALPSVLSTKTSIWGRGKSSLGQALFKSLKSTHILTFPSFLGTGTTLAIHSAWCVGLMNPTFNYFVTSSLIFKSHSVLMCLNFCLMGPYGYGYQCDVGQFQDQFRAYLRRTTQTLLEIM